MLDNVATDPAPTSPPSQIPRALRGCLFLLGGKPCAVDIRDAREVIVLRSCTSVPGAPRHLIGVTSVRGSVVPVVEVRPLLGLPVRPVVVGTLALVVRFGASQVAIPIEQMLGLDWFDAVRARDEQTIDAPAFVSGCLGRGEERFTLLAASRILTTLKTWAQEGD